MPELSEATFGCGVHALKTEICRFALGSAQHVRERHEVTKNISKVSRKDHCIHEAASGIDFQNQAPFVKTFRD